MNKISKKNFIYNLIYQLFVLIMPLVTAPYVSRVFGPEGVGVYSFNYSIATYFVYFELLGINNYGVREIAKCTNDEERNQVFSDIYFSQFIISIVVIILYITYMFILGGINFTIILCFLPYVISGMLDINWYFFGTEKFSITTIRNCIVKLLVIVLIFVFIKNSNDLWIYCLIISGAALLTQLIMWACFFKKGKIKKPRFSYFFKHIKGLFILFVPVLAVSLYRVMDKIMLGFFSTKEYVGFYENAEQIISVPGTITTALGVSMLPRMTNMLSHDDKNSFNDAFKSSVIFVEYICFPMAFGILAVSDTFIPLYYGENFIHSSQVLKVLCLSFVFSSLASVLRTQYLIPKNKDRIYIGSVISGAITNLIMNIVLIPHFNAIGAAVGTVIANVVVALYQLLFVYKEYNEVKIYLKGLVFLPLSLAMYLIILFATNNISINNILLLIIKVLIGVVFYAIITIPFIVKWRNKERECKNEY